MRDENFFICWSDFKRALRGKGGLVRGAALFSAGAFFLFAALRSPIFEGEALFHVKTNNSNSMSAGGIGGILQLATGSSTSQRMALTLSVLESRTIGERVIEATGLQIAPRPEGRTFFLLRNFKDNLLSEFAWWTNRPSGATDARNHAWSFRDVFYQGLYKKPFTLVFDRDGGFELISAGSRFPGKIGELFCGGDISFTLDADRKALSGRRLEFIAEPMFKTLDQYKRRLSAKLSKRKNDTIAIAYCHRSPKLSMEVTNVLMSEYLKALKLDAKRVTDEQLQFLAQAQEQSYGDLSNHLDDYLSFVKESVDRGGYLRTKDALEVFVKNYGLTQQKLGELEREAAMLAQSNPVLVSTSHWPLQTQLAKYNEQLHALNTRKNSMEIALQKSSSLDGRVLEHLQAQEKERQQSMHLVNCISNSSDKKYYRSLLASSNLRRRIHEFKMFAAAAPPSEIQGLGLEASMKNYQIQMQALNSLKEQEVSLDQAIDRIGGKDFDTGALIDTLEVGRDFQRKVQECHSLSLALRDTKNYSARENARLREELKEKYAALQKHLASVREVNLMQQVRTKEWIHRAQVGLLGLIVKEISLVEEEVKRIVDRRRTDLESEIESHKLALSKLKKQMASMPKAWLQEKKLDMQTRFQSEMMQVLSSLVESRQISAALDVVESKPLDSAIFPLRPKPPHLALFALAGTIVGLICAALHAIAVGALRGFSVSRDNLRVRGQFVAGLQDSEKEKALFHTNQNILFCTGLDRDEFMRVVELAKLQGEKVKVAARKSDLDGADIELRRLHADEICAAAEGLDRLFVYVSKSPLSTQTLATVGLKGDWMVRLREEKVRDLAPYFEASEKSRIAFLLSSSR